MEVFIGLLVVGAIWYFFFRGTSKSASPAPIEVPVKISISTSSGGDFVPEPVDTGPLTEVDGGYVLNPRSPLPLALLGASRADAQTLKEQLDKQWVEPRVRQEFAFWIAQKNLRCRDIDSYVSKYRKQFEVTVEKLRASSAEWPVASAKDREDLQKGYEEQALEAIREKPARARGLRTLLQGEPTDVTSDDALMALFGKDTEAYKSYLYMLSNTGMVRVVPADDYWRKRYELFVEKGLARRGQDIPMADILESLRLKDINESLKGLVEKPFGRKAKAIEYALTVSDLKDRIGALVSFRELFQIQTPPGLDVSELQRNFAYASEVANLFCDTYAAGVQTLRTLFEHKEMPFKSWRIHADSCCSSCAAMHGKTYKTKPSKVPPYHLGCDCELFGTFSDELSQA